MFFSSFRISFWVKNKIDIRHLLFYVWHLLCHFFSLCFFNMGKFLHKFYIFFFIKSNPQLSGVAIVSFSRESLRSFLIFRKDKRKSIIFLYLKFPLISSCIYNTFSLYISLFFPNYFFSYSRKFYFNKFFLFSRKQKSLQTLVKISHTPFFNIIRLWFFRTSKKKNWGKKIAKFFNSFFFIRFVDGQKFHSRKIRQASREKNFHSSNITVVVKERKKKKKIEILPCTRQMNLKRNSRRKKKENFFLYGSIDYVYSYK